MSMKLPRLKAKPRIRYGSLAISSVLIADERLTHKENILRPGMAPVQILPVLTVESRRSSRGLKAIRRRVWVLVRFLSLMRIFCYYLIEERQHFSATIKSHSSVVEAKVIYDVGR